MIGETISYYRNVEQSGDGMGVAGGSGASITVVVNWPALLKEIKFE
jgi:hypothetical protein